MSLEAALPYQAQLEVHRDPVEILFGHANYAHNCG